MGQGVEGGLEQRPCGHCAQAGFVRDDPGEVEHPVPAGGRGLFLGVVVVVVMVTMKDKMTLKMKVMKTAKNKMMTQDLKKIMMTPTTMVKSKMTTLKMMKIS